MRILYIATDVTLPAMNGGSRRAYETAKIFHRFGHRSVVLVDRKKGERSFEEYEGIRVYRTKLPEIGHQMREMIAKIRGLFIKRNNTDFSYYSDKPSKYDTYFPHLMQHDLRWKIQDFYRHKLPLHKWLKIVPAAYRLFQIIKREKIDVIIERGPSYGVGALISKLFHILYIIDFIDIMYCNLALRCADAVLSYFTTIQIPQFVDRNKIQLVYTCADTELFQPRDKNLVLLKRYGFHKDDFVIIYVGGMYPWHGLEIIVQSAELIVQEGYTEVKILLVGDGVVRPQMEQLVVQKELQDYVKFVGVVDFEEVPSYINSADVALSLNTGDSIGFKLIEYMASGIPIIATNADILPFAGKENREMLYVNQNDPIHLKEKILYLLTNPDIAHSIGRNARKRVENRYRWEVHYWNILNAIKSSIQQK
ncbi:MAG: glycosyltransferase family 4 protein [Candidatus Lokiarchaeota archaeon]|nr:glycosyltransferase family 4 protein [Candidatus Lokiarchaeota archaeon]